MEASRFGVVSLHVDRLGRLWIIGLDGSVRRIDDLSTRQSGERHESRTQPVGANVRCMVEDASGNFYFGTTSGIIEVDPRTGDTRRYTTAEGLAQNEVWSALASRRGDIWFGTIAGVSRLDATRVRPRTPAPRALITTVHVNGVARLVSELGDHAVSELTLAPSEREVAIGFFALTFAPGEHLRYQYRLEGAETRLERAESGARRALFSARARALPVSSESRDQRRRWPASRPLPWISSFCRLCGSGGGFAPASSLA